MAKQLHTAYGDEIREIAKTDPIQAEEMKHESIGYQNEVRGFYDEEYDPYDEYYGCDRHDSEPEEDDSEGQDG